MKKILSVLLALCLLAGCVPLGAWADELQGDPPLGIVGYRQSAEDAKTALTKATNRWNLSDEEASKIFTEENNSKSNWMWAPLPKYGSVEDVKGFTLELTSGEWKHTVNFETTNFFGRPAKGGPIVAVWLLEDATFPEGKVMAQLKDASDNNVGDSREVDCGGGGNPGTDEPQYPDHIEITNIDYAGIYGKMWLDLTLDTEQANKLVYGFTVIPKDSDEIWGRGVSYKDAERGNKPTLEMGEGPGDENFKFCAGTYTVNLYRFNGDRDSEGKPVFSTEEKNRLCFGTVTLEDEMGDVYVCAGHDPIENFDEFAAAGSPLSQIVITEVNNKTKTVSLKGRIVSAEDYLDLTLHTFRPTEGTPTPHDWLSGTYIRLLRNTQGGYDVAPDTLVGDGYGWINHMNTWLKGSDYKIDTGGLENDPPTVNEEKKAATSTGAVEGDVAAVLATLNSDGGKSAVTIENSGTILQNAAAENITQADADKAIYELTGYQPVASKQTRAAASGASAKIEIVAKTSLDVDVKSANLTGTSKSIKLDITPKAQVVAMAQELADKEQALAGFDQPKALEVKSEVKLSIPLPAGFAENGQKLYIKHKGHVYEGKVADGKVTFTNPDGFSEFEILTEKPAEPVTPPSGGNSSTTPKDEVITTPTVSGGTANSTVSSSQGASLVEAAKQPSTGEVTVKVDTTQDVTAANVTLPASIATGVGAAKADLKVETPVAEITLPSAALTSLGTGASNVTMSTAVNSDDTVSITVKKDSTTVTTLAQPMKAAIPAPDITGTTVAVLVNEDGTETVIPKSISGKDEISLLLGGSAKIKLKDNSKAFNDTKDHWADNNGSIGFATSRELFQGVSDSSFAPDQPMTRGMIVTVLHLLESKPKGSTANFTDVPGGAYYAEAVAWGNEKGIVQGTGANSFTPNQNVTREQLATFLYRYAAKYGVDTTGRTSLTSFPDSGNVSGYAKDALEWAYHTGLIKGTDNGRLDPTGSATRGQVAAILMRFVEYINK